ncbi:MAG: capsular polysaccharide synthesis protein [Bacillota bacterium]|nr:capsular polysaccharide synthesis protein [Bacillota bacterium]MDW7676763.1 capsular polysaccharide synthesis protein [Bacillota bacterium]
MQSIQEASHIAENDKLRSQYIRELIQEAVIREGAPVKTPFSKTKISKIIVQFWHDLNEIPNDVQECFDSWEPLKKKGFKRVLFDDAGARHFISKNLGNYYLSAFNLCHHPAMRCDYFRLCYMITNGGFYVDADEICQGSEFSNLFYDSRLKIQALCYDTATGMMIEPDLFISKRGYSPDWIFYVNNNPIIAPPNHPVIRLALNRATHLLLSCPDKRSDIQSTTGPGNLTISLVKHSITSKSNCRNRDVLILTNWEDMSISPWPLSYRNDERNWRLWNPLESKAGKTR